MNSLVLKKWLQKPLVLALLLNVVALIISLLLSNGKFSSLDDHFMAMALTGAYGGGFDPHLYFVNSVYAYFLWPFYKLFPGVGWYTIFQITSVFVSFTVICFVVLKNCGIKVGFVLSSLVLICSSSDFYLHIAFTQCAGALTASGFLLIAFASQNAKLPSRRFYLQLFMGVLLAIGGFVMRKNMFLLGLPTLGAMLFFYFAQKRIALRTTILALFSLVVCIAGLKFFDDSLFKSKGYDYYAAYQPVRAMFGDGEFYDSNSIPDEMDEVEMISRDFRYLKAWYFYDKDVYSIDSLNRKAEIVKRNVFVPNFIKMPIAVMRELANNILTGHFWCWTFLCFCLVFFQRKKNVLMPWMSLGIMSVSYAYILLINRVVGHVEAGIWLYSVTLLLPVVNENVLGKEKIQKYCVRSAALIGFFGVLCIVVGFAFDKNQMNDDQTRKDVQKWALFREYAEIHKDDVFFLPFDRYKELAKNAANVYKTYEPNSWNNIVSLGYWNILFPPIENELAKRGVTNPMRDVVHENVYVIDDVTKMSLAPFYDDHYHKRISIDTICTFGDINLLKYRLRTNEIDYEKP